MTTAPADLPEWRKSSRSDGNDTCVEVRRDLTAVRDSKNLQGPSLRVDVAVLVTEIRAGRLDAE